jgi:hypothetical protein
MVIGLSHFPVIGQEPTSIPLNCSLIKILDVKADHISTDYLGHIYTILDDQLSKYDTKGDLIATYSNKYLGKISMIDASNPLRVLVFYQDFGQLVFLDDMLSLIGDPIVLEELGMDQSTLACISVNDGIWLYEPQDFKLIRMDRNLKVTGEVYQVNQLVGTIVEPVFLLEKDNLVYLNNPGTGILVFDIFGAYIKTIPLEISNEFQVIRNTILYYNNQGFHTYDLSLFNLARYDIPGSLNHITSVRIEMGKDLLVVQKETRIELMIIRD